MLFNSTRTKEGSFENLEIESIHVVSSSAPKSETVARFVCVP
jgi:hypothetical protein